MKHSNNNQHHNRFYQVFYISIIFFAFIYTPITYSADINLRCKVPAYKFYTERIQHTTEEKLDFVKNAATISLVSNAIMNINLSKIVDGPSFRDTSDFFAADYETRPDYYRSLPRYGDKYKNQANPVQKQLVEDITKFCAAHELSSDNKSDMKYIHFDINGNIEEGDAEILAVIINGVELVEKYFKRQLPIFLSLNSGGGDVHEAIKIGRLISKDANLTTRIEPNEVCASSCVLILAAGNTKSIFGKVGIHRMSFMGLKSSKLVPEEYRKIYDSSMDNLKLYLSELGISTQLAEDMMRYSSDDIHILSNNEIDSYGLSKDNPYNYELKKSKEIARCGEDWYKTKLVLNEVASSRCAANKLKSNDADVGWRCIDEIMLPHYKTCNRNE